jgi:hypothetical protein
MSLVLIDKDHSKSGIEVLEDLQVRINGNIIKGLKPNILIVRKDEFYYGVVECMRGKNSRSSFVSNGIVVKVGEAYESSNARIEYVEDERFQ